MLYVHSTHCSIFILEVILCPLMFDMAALGKRKRSRDKSLEVIAAYNWGTHFSLCQGSFPLCSLRDQLPHKFGYHQLPQNITCAANMWSNGQAFQEFCLQDYAVLNTHTWQYLVQSSEDCQITKGILQYVNWAWLALRFGCEGPGLGSSHHR